MFNEAFMFFWVIAVLDNIVGVSIAVLVFSLLGLTFGTFVFGVEFDFSAERAGGLRKFLYASIIACVVSMVMIIFTPPKEAFYAGAAQYVGEATEIDQTMLRLKTLLDQKIEELSEPEE